MNFCAELFLAVRNTVKLSLNQKHYLTSSFLAIPKRGISTNSDEEVIAQDNEEKGVLIFNRPKVYNAVNLSMITKFYDTLLKWEKEKTMVIAKGAGGKAFCAGGDIKSMANASKKDGDYAKAVFRQEYLLNCLIATYAIPYVALIDGITMGGGLGMSVHGQYRVATEKTVSAMPETAIGLFPDVGASYFFPRMKGKLGVFLALTGYRLRGVDNFFVGFATHFCSSTDLPKIEEALLASKSPEEVLRDYKGIPAGSKFSLELFLKKIDEVFSALTVEEIVLNLKKDESNWAKETLAGLKKLSPLSLKITLKALQIGAHLSLQECLQMEYRLACRLCEGPNFLEGVRALLIDKDHNPKWEPSTLEGVTQTMVDDCFAPLGLGKELEPRHGPNSSLGRKNP